MAGAELIHHGEPEEGQRRGGFQRPGLHQIFQQRTGNQAAFFLAVLAQIEALQLGSDGAFQRVEGEVGIAVLTFAQGQLGTGHGAAIQGSTQYRRQRRFHTLPSPVNQRWLQRSTTPSSWAVIR